MYSREEAQLFRKDFWSTFADFTKYYAKNRGEPIIWMFYKTGIKGLELKFDIEADGIQVAIEVNLKNENTRFDIFVELDKYKNIIESGFNGEVVWSEDYKLPNGKVVSRIYLALNGVKYQNRDNWPVIFHFMAENMIKLQNNLIEILPLLDDKFGKPAHYFNGFC